MATSFTQLSFGSNTKEQQHSVNATTLPLSIDALTPERKKDFRLQLVSQLQTTMEIDHLMSIFHRHLKQILHIGGIIYRNSEQKIDVLTGNSGKHRCTYQLTMKDADYGEISFTRNKRFSELEMTFIESIMDTLIFPIKNSLKFREALATAMIDPLTGLNNRSAMAISLTREIERSRRHNDQPISIVMIDVDHFKSINDRYGHLTGDHVLRNIAQIIQFSIRGSDACFRFGGEEFLLYLTNSTPSLARVVSERIRKAIMDSSLLPDKERSITASFGIAHYSGESDWPQLVARADKALYTAKQQGRNQVVTSIEAPQANFA